MGLVLCNRCKRHIRTHEPCCPFCRAHSAKRGRSLGAAALVVGGGLSAAVGCQPAYGPPPMDDPTRADGGQLTVWKDDAGAAEEQSASDAASFD